MDETSALLGDEPTMQEPEIDESKFLDVPGMESSEVVSGVMIEEPLKVSVGSGPNYVKAANRLKSEPLFLVENTAEIPLILDWDLNLMPADLKPQFDNYLTRKYIQYNLSHMVGKVTFVAILHEGQTINFLHNFMNEKSVPTIISITEGMRTNIKSQFIIRPHESVLCTEKQIESLQRFKKSKIENPGEKGKVTYSDWVGFLIFRPVNKSNLKNAKRSIISIEDCMASGTTVSATEMRSRSERKEVRTIDATE